jgi:uncharacterized protein YbaR (Trm112 family)
MSADAVQRTARLPIDLLVCPRCTGTLNGVSSELHCGSCGAAYPVDNGIPILMPPDLDDVHQRYVRNYESVAGADMAASLETLRHARHAGLRRFVGSVAGKRVLDIGASDAAFLRSLDYREAVAFDIALPYLKTIPSTPDLTAVCGDAERLPFRYSAFDVILLTDILEHVLDPAAVVYSIQRLAGPKTRIIVEVPWEENLDSYRDDAWEFTHLRSFDLFSFSTLWARFRIVRMHDSVPRLDVPIFLDGRMRLPLPVLNRLRLLYHHGGIAEEEFVWRNSKLMSTKRDGRLLLHFSRPLVRQFELRPFSETELSTAGEDTRNRFLSTAGRLLSRLL